MNPKTQHIVYRDYQDRFNKDKEDQPKLVKKSQSEAKTKGIDF